MKWDYEGEYLKQFDSNYLGAIGNMFCQAVRRGCDDVDSILDYVRRDCLDRDAPVYGRVLHSLGSLDSRHFADHILWREYLPADEAKRLKEESRRESAAKFKTFSEPTEKQLKYLKSLGCDVVPSSMAEASELIGQCLKK